METKKLADACLNQLFRSARSHNAWQDRQVDDGLLVELYELMKWGPTSANGCPARVVFLRTPEAKHRLLPALSPGNIDKTLSAPVTAIIAYDTRFFDHLPILFPHNPSVRDWFEGNPELVQVTALRNSSLQGAYFMMAARALGLDCGPMSGFDHELVDREFFAPETGPKRLDIEAGSGGHVKSNFLCNLGYGDPAKLFPRSPRLSFAQACTLL